MFVIMQDVSLGTISISMERKNIHWIFLEIYISASIHEQIVLIIIEIVPNKCHFIITNMNEHSYLT